MNAAELKNRIVSGGLDEKLTVLYGKDQLEAQKVRYTEAVDAFVELYGDRENLTLFSAPGRTEIAGNHTDHNHGRVVAASVNMDAAPSRSSPRATQWILWSFPIWTPKPLRKTRPFP